ncbi:MAG: glycosyltransferase, partial [Nitrososphaeraceae archaeon]|nr:glycosyltransferase [Nitrososphaeraceae archaeon]
NEYEIIVIDNGSTDNTKKEIEDLNQRYDNRISYFYDPRPGLHIGRHLGAKHARGEILLYCDDDIIASPDWVKEIYACYSKKEVGAAGGKILPKFEITPPKWLKLFHSGYLSLLNLGDEYLEINTNEIYGCNLSIRREVLFKLGGFHPDGMPQNLIKYRGDGESALMTSVVNAGYKTVYNPKAFVYHVIPSSRLTIDYFKQRAFNQGVSDSYSSIRKYGKIEDNVYADNNRKTNIFGRIFEILRFIIKNRTIKFLKYPNKVRDAYIEGMKYHMNEVKNDPELLEYILKENYFV